MNSRKKEKILLQKVCKFGKQIFLFNITVISKVNTLRLTTLLKDPTNKDKKQRNT